MFEATLVHDAFASNLMSELGSDRVLPVVAAAASAPARAGPARRRRRERTELGLDQPPGRRGFNARQK